MDIPIEPAVKSYEITKLTYQIDSLVANKFCQISAFLAERDGNRIKRMQLMLEGEEYGQWGNDDEWLLQWIRDKCGFVKPVEPEETIVESVEPVLEQN